METTKKLRISSAPSLMGMIGVRLLVSLLVVRCEWRQWRDLCVSGAWFPAHPRRQETSGGSEPSAVARHGNLVRMELSTRLAKLRGWPRHPVSTGSPQT